MKMCDAVYSVHMKNPPFRTSLFGCACWLRSPAPPKVQPMRPAWAFAALLLTLLRLRVRGSYSWRPSDLAPSLEKGGRAAEQRAGCQGRIATQCAGCQGWQPWTGMRSMDCAVFMQPWAFRRSRNAQPERGGFSNPPFSDFTILLRPKIQGSRPWLPARRFAPRPPFTKGGGHMPIRSRCIHDCPLGGSAPRPPFAKGGSALCARGDLSQVFFQLLQGR